jgi:ABC-2 type transport system permease protein
MTTTPVTEPPGATTPPGGAPGDGAIAPVRVAARGWAHDLRAVRIVAQRELIRWSKDRGRLVAGLVQPLLWLFVLGAGLSRVVATNGGFDFQTFLFPGIVVISVLFQGIFSGISLVWDREFGFLREMLVAPVSRGAILVGKCLGGASVAFLQGLVMIALAGAVHVPYHPLLIVELAAMAFLISMTITALGLLLAARIRQVQSAMPVVQLLLTPMMFLSGAMFPLGDLPTWLMILTRLNPLTYAVQPMRAAVFSFVPVDAATMARLDPPLTWFGWPVPIGLQVAFVALTGVALLTVAIHRFSQTD